MYRERSAKELVSMTPEQVRAMQERRKRIHEDWHNQFSGENDDCPFQYLGEDWLTKKERKILQLQGCGCGYSKIVRCGEAMYCPSCGWYQASPPK